MPPKSVIGEGLTWGWACSTGNPASDQRLDAAAKAAWSYAVLCAWTYLHDHDAAHDLMDFAVQNASGYAARYPETSLNKLTARIKSVLKRRVKQISSARSHELSYGSLAALEGIYASRPDAEQKVYTNELLARLSPFAQSILKWRWLGYTWREISKHLEMDHTAVRRAYFREMNELLENLPQPGDHP